MIRIPKPFNRISRAHFETLPFAAGNQNNDATTWIIRIVSNIELIAEFMPVREPFVEQR
ncbi:hypothetical protein SAMN06298226_0447 [Nitrosovibrio sp. Nv4]|nr:hypothetical protein SAMN06298226_0447 [Nitrosovibrio sp. Nv4]